MRDTPIKTICKLCEMKKTIIKDKAGHCKIHPIDCPYNILHREVEKLRDELQVIKFKK